MFYLANIGGTKIKKRIAIIFAGYGNFLNLIDQEDVFEADH